MQRRAIAIRTAVVVAGLVVATSRPAAAVAPISRLFATGDSVFVEFLSHSGDVADGGDRDHHDFDVVLSGVSTTVTPEPLSMSLLAIGLASMGGLTLLRRRRR